jgi:hypothetical protein
VPEKGQPAPGRRGLEEAQKLLSSIDDDEAVVFLAAYQALDDDMARRSDE